MQEKTKSMLYLQRISGSSRNGPGAELHGTIRKGPYSKTATGQRDLEYRLGPYLRGPADDITLCHYRASDICRRFGDTVCITAPGNHRLHLQMTVPVPCIKTASQASVTKTVGP